MLPVLPGLPAFGHALLSRNTSPTPTPYIAHSFVGSHFNPVILCGIPPFGTLLCTQKITMELRAVVFLKSFHAILCMKLGLHTAINITISVSCKVFNLLSSLLESPLLDPVGSYLFYWNRSKAAPVRGHISSCTYRH